MIFCSGWLVLGASEAFDDRFNDRLAVLRSMLGSHPDRPQRGIVDTANYATFLQFWESHNHAGDTPDRLKRFLRAVCDLFDESFGCLIVADNETESESDTTMLVIRGSSILQPSIPSVFA